MPFLKDWKCRECGSCFEFLEMSEEDIATCPCGSQNCSTIFSGFGGYVIRGKNNSSTKPKSSGSFKAGKVTQWESENSCWRDLDGPAIKEI